MTDTSVNGIATTRLRYIKVKTAGEIPAALDSLKFRVELKGAPVYDGKHWYCWFVLPDSIDINFDSVEIK